MRGRTAIQDELHVLDRIEVAKRHETDPVKKYANPYLP